MPSSISISTETAVTGLVIDASANSVFGAHRLLRVDVGEAMCLEVDQLAFARDERHGAGEVLRVDVLADSDRIRPRRADDRPTSSGLADGVAGRHRCCEPGEPRRAR